MKRFSVIIFVLIFCLSLLISCQSKGGTVNKSEENKSAEALTSEEKIPNDTNEATKEATSAKSQEKTQEYTQEDNNDTTYPEVVIHPNVKMSVSKKSFKSDEAVEVSLKDEAKLGFFQTRKHHFRNLCTRENDNQRIKHIIGRLCHDRAQNHDYRVQNPHAYGDF